MYRFAALGPVDQRCVAAKHIEYTSLVVHPLEFRLIQQTLVGHPGTIDHIHALLQECFRASLQQDGIVHRNIFLHQPIQFLSCFGIKRIGVTALDLIKGDMHLFAKEEITIDGSIVLQDIISKFRMGLVREISQTCHIAQDCNTVIILRNGQVLQHRQRGSDRCRGRIEAIHIERPVAGFHNILPDTAGGEISQPLHDLIPGVPRCSPTAKAHTAFSTLYSPRTLICTSVRSLP